MLERLAICGLLGASIYAQTYPLESVAITGTKISQEVIMEIARLKLGMPIDKPLLDQASARLGGSGLFETVEYQYQLGPKRGFAVTFSLLDRVKLVKASVDVPGVDDGAVWNWLVTRYPPFDHLAPDSGDGQEFLAHEIETHLLGQLSGHHIVSQMETEMGAHGGSLLSFHLDVMPQIAALTFSGNREVSDTELRAQMMRVIGTDGYMERQFRREVELNLLGIYEQHGMYRVKFPAVKMERAGSDAVTVTTVIEEGPQYRLGTVRFTGERVVSGEMEAAGNFRTGEVANWREVDGGVQQSLRVLRSAGYLDVTGSPQRQFDDEQHVLTLEIPVSLGRSTILGRFLLRA